MLHRAQQSSASCSTGNHPLVLKQNQPQVLAQLSAWCSEDELVPHPWHHYSTWPGFLPRALLPCQAKPSEQVHTLWLGLPPSPLLLPTALQEAPTEGILAQSPGASFLACAGNGANYCVTSCSLKGIPNEADRIALSTVEESKT